MHLSVPQFGGSFKRHKYRKEKKEINCPFFDFSEKFQKAFQFNHCCPIYQGFKTPFFLLKTYGWFSVGSIADGTEINRND